MKAFVPPIWLIAGAVAAVALGVVGLGALALTGGSDSDDVTAKPTPTATATEGEGGDEGEGDDTATPTPTPTPTEEVVPAPDSIPVEPPPSPRSYGVSVLSKSTTDDQLAADGYVHLAHRGWGDLKSGNCSNACASVTGNGVFYPPGMEEAAREAAADLGLSTVQPSLPSMRSDRVSVVLVNRPAVLKPS
ncbi:MAG: hypothetical protein QM621_09285 [Aeromicrobium sp.]|uniref:hypothetical protein n=1 Tax=Aeromicrobium sp. TaxID=1871063 RepID=UPI0039E2F1FB